MFHGIINVENPADNQVTDLFEEQIRVETYGDECEPIYKVGFLNRFQREYKPKREMFA